MKDFAGPKDDRKEDELERVPEFMRGSAYLDRRQQQILQAEQAMIGIRSTIRNVTIDIARLLAATPSAGNQAMLERSFGELNGLANAASQTALATPTGGDSGISRGADVDLTGTRAAIESHINSSNGSTLKDVDNRTQKKAVAAKELPSLDNSQEPSVDPSTRDAANPATDLPGDAKPTGTDTPTSNLDRLNKLASEASRTPDDPVASASSDTSLLPDKPSSRSKVATLKIDHTEITAKSDGPERQSGQGVQPTAQGASALAKGQPTSATVVHKPPSPGGM